MLYLDANFFVNALLNTGEKGESARKLRAEIIKGERQAVTSVLALDELMWALLKDKKRELIRRTVEQTYATPNLAIKEVPPLTALMAVDAMEAHGLKPRDAFHLAVMKQFGVTEIVTDDTDFDRVPGIRRIGF